MHEIHRKPAHPGVRDELAGDLTLLHINFSMAWEHQRVAKPTIGRIALQWIGAVPRRAIAASYCN